MRVVKESRYHFANDPEKALADYQEFGYHIEPNMLMDEECNNLIEKSKQLDSATDGTFRPCMMPHRQDEIYKKAMSNKKIVNIMTK